MPALLRTAAPVRMKGVLPVGDPAAYDDALDAMLRTMLGLKPPAPPQIEGEGAADADADGAPAPALEGGAAGAEGGDAAGAPSAELPPPPKFVPPSNDCMLCMAALVRYAWGAMRKGSDAQGKKKEHARLESASEVRTRHQ